MNIDTQIVWRDALAMERIDPADFAKKVSRCASVELILSERFFTCEKLEPALVHFDHKCVLPLADGAVAHREFWEVGLDFEANCSAVACAAVGL